MSNEKERSDFSVFQEMSDKNMDISCAVEQLDFQRTPKRNGGRVTFGVASPYFDHLINQAATGEVTHHAILYIINKKQFDEIKNRIERPITEQFLLSLGWTKDTSLNDRTFYFHKSKFTLEIDRDFAGSNTIIYDEYGFHDGLRYSGDTPNESQYRTLNQLLKIHE